MRKAAVLSLAAPPKSISALQRRPNFRQLFGYNQNNAGTSHYIYYLAQRSLAVAVVTARCTKVTPSIAGYNGVLP